MSKTIALDAPKLTGIIEKFLGDVDVRCCTVSACIGEVDGKQVQIRVQGDDEEFMESLPKWKCVSVVQN